MDSIDQEPYDISHWVGTRKCYPIYYYFYVLREAFSESDNPNPIEISRLNAVLIVVCGVTVLLLRIFVFEIPI